MSSILEALKKLEEEKATRLSGAGNIAGKVVRTGRRARQRPAWWLPAGMACTAVIAAAATYVFTGGGFFASKQEPSPVPAPLSRPQAVAVSPEAPAQPAESVAAPPAKPVQSAQTVVAPPARRAPPPDLPTVAEHYGEPAPSPRPISRPKPAINAVARQQAEPKIAERPPTPPKLTTTPSQPAASSSHPRLTVTGIGWQKDNADRLAIINGKAVSEGTIIEGAKVEEIFPDRVRFSLGDQTFDISLGKASGETP